MFSRFVSIVLIIILSPLYTIISILSLIFQGAPIIYKQERIGYNYSPFFLYKFRSMINNQSNIKITDSTDTRITLWGKFLRFSKLDELPQLLNIIKGDMQFVGPRPEVREYINRNQYSFIKEIKPGLTDFSSILFRDESKILSRAGGISRYPQLVELKVSLGNLYFKNKNFLLDMKLVLLTLISIIFPTIAIKLVKKYFINKFDSRLIPLIDNWLV